MKKLKDMLIGTLGVVGYVLWFIVSLWFTFTPIIFLDISFWITLLLTAVILIVGDIVALPLWIWSFVVVVSEPIDGWSIAYFITFAVYALTTIIPTAITILQSIIVLIASKFNNKSHN